MKTVERKKTTLLIIALVFILLLIFGQTVFAGTGTTLTVQSVTAEAGETQVQVPILLSNNTQGLSGADIIIEYDKSNLTLLDVLAGEVLQGPDSLGQPNTVGQWRPDLELDTPKIVWLHEENITTTSGTFATLVFSVAADAPAGDYQITLSSGNTGTDEQGNTYNESFTRLDENNGPEYIDVDLAAGSISVTNSNDPGANMAGLAYPLTVPANTTESDAATLTITPEVEAAGAEWSVAAGQAVKEWFKVTATVSPAVGSVQLGDIAFSGTYAAYFTTDGKYYDGVYGAELSSYKLVNEGTAYFYIANENAAGLSEGSYTVDGTVSYTPYGAAAVTENFSQLLYANKTLSATTSPLGTGADPWVVDATDLAATSNAMTITVTNISGNTAFPIHIKAELLGTSANLFQLDKTAPISLASGKSAEITLSPRTDADAAAAAAWAAAGPTATANVNIKYGFSANVFLYNLPVSRTAQVARYAVSVTRDSATSSDTPALNIADNGSTKKYWDLGDFKFGSITAASISSNTAKTTINITNTGNQTLWMGRLSTPPGYQFEYLNANDAALTGTGRVKLDGGDSIKLVVKADPAYGQAAGIYTLAKDDLVAKFYLNQTASVTETPWAEATFDPGANMAGLAYTVTKYGLEVTAVGEHWWAAPNTSIKQWFKVQAAISPAVRSLQLGAITLDGTAAENFSTDGKYYAAVDGAELTSSALANGGTAYFYIASKGTAGLSANNYTASGTVGYYGHGETAATTASFTKAVYVQDPLSAEVTTDLIAGYNWVINATTAGAADGCGAVQVKITNNSTAEITGVTAEVGGALKDLVSIALPTGFANKLAANTDYIFTLTPDKDAGWAALLEAAANPNQKLDLTGTLTLSGTSNGQTVSGSIDITAQLWRYAASLTINTPEEPAPAPATLTMGAGESAVTYRDLGDFPQNAEINATSNAATYTVVNTGTETMYLEMIFPNAAAYAAAYANKFGVTYTDYSASGLIELAAGESTTFDVYPKMPAANTGSNQTQTLGADKITATFKSTDNMSANVRLTATADMGVAYTVNSYAATYEWVTSSWTADADYTNTAELNWVKFKLNEDLSTRTLVLNSNDVLLTTGQEGDTPDNFIAGHPTYSGKFFESTEPTGDGITTWSMSPASTLVYIPVYPVADLTVGEYKASFTVEGQTGRGVESYTLPISFSVGFTPATFALDETITTTYTGQELVLTAGAEDAGDYVVSSGSTDITWKYALRNPEDVSPPSSIVWSTTGELPTDAGTYWICGVAAASGVYATAYSNVAKLTIEPYTLTAWPAATWSITDDGKAVTDGTIKPDYTVTVELAYASGSAPEGVTLPDDLTTLFTFKWDKSPDPSATSPTWWDLTGTTNSFLVTTDEVGKKLRATLTLSDPNFTTSSSLGALELITAHQVTYQPIITVPLEDDKLVVPYNHGDPVAIPMDKISIDGYKQNDDGTTSPEDITTLFENIPPDFAYMAFPEPSNPEWIHELPTAMGDYLFYIELKAPDNSYYEDPSSATHLLTVAPAAPEWALTAQTRTYNGSAVTMVKAEGENDNNFDVKSDAATVSWKYTPWLDTDQATTQVLSTDTARTWTAGLPSDAGSYWIYGSVEATTNYKASASPVVSLTIDKAAGQTKTIQINRVYEPNTNENFTLYYDLKDLNLGADFSDMSITANGVTASAVSGTGGVTGDTNGNGSQFDFAAKVSAPGPVYEVTVSFDSRNYATSTLKMTVNIVDKEELEIRSVALTGGTAGEAPADPGQPTFRLYNYTSGASPVTVDKGSIQAGTLAGEVFTPLAPALAASNFTYTYYQYPSGDKTRAADANDDLTDDDGAATEGGAPKYAGKYYLRVEVAHAQYKGQVDLHFEIKPIANDLAFTCSSVEHGTALAPAVSTNPSGMTVSYSYRTTETSDAFTDGLPTAVGDYDIKGVTAANRNYLAGEHIEYTVQITYKATFFTWLKDASGKPLYGGFVYDGAPVPLPSADQYTISGSNRTVAFTYYEQYSGLDAGNNVLTFSDDSDPANDGQPPMDAGTYYVEASAPVEDHYAALTSALQFVIQPPATVPAAPSGSISAGADWLSVSWSPNDDGGADITGYRLSISGQSGYVEVAANIRQYTFNDLEAGVNYTISITAVNSVGAGAALDLTGSPSGSSGGPGRPALVKTVEAKNGSATLDADELRNVSRLRVKYLDYYVEMSATMLRNLKIEDSLRIVIDELHPIPTVRNYEMRKLVLGVQISIYVDGRQVTSFPGGFKLFIPYPEHDGLIVLHVNDSGLGRQIEDDRISRSKRGVLLSCDTTSFYALAEKGGFIQAPLISGGFTDVAGRWSEPYINYLAGLGVVSGQGNGLFAPTANVTRAEFVKMLAGIAGADVTSYAGKAGFVDVSATAWYEPYVAWAASQGIAKGLGQGIYGPNNNITRQEMAVMIYRFCQVNDYQLPQLLEAVSFRDADSIAAWAVEAVTVMQRAGVISGLGDGSFAPTAFTTREAAAKMLAVTHQLLND